MRWYASRLEAMSWGERAHRVREACLRKTVKLDKPVAVTGSDQLFLTTKPVLLATLADTTFCSSGPLKAHDSILAYGQQWPLDQSGLPLWHHMLNGSDSAATPTFKVHYRNSSDLRDDVRINWELNRLTWLIPTATHACKTQMDPDVKFVIQVLESFLASDRVGYSSRWSSSIELAMQALSLIIVSSLVDLAMTSSELHTRVSSAILTRYEWLKRFPSKYSSANNHLLAELAALSVISGVTPSLQSAHSKHVELFTSECARQFNDDGLNAELATDYHLYALDLMATVLYYSPVPEHTELKALTHQVTQATKNVVDFCGFWPRISDSDHAAVLSNVAVESDRATWLVKFCEDLLGVELDTTDAQSLSFATSGYSFLKSDDASSELLMLVDHGYLGFGDIAGHAHADSAAIWVWVNQEPLLIESGTYSYHSRDDLRDALRSSMWHNTISINGASTSTPDGPFLWLRNKRATARLLSLSPSNATIEVNIPKNAVLTSSATHRRDISIEGLRLSITEHVSANVAFQLASHLIVDHNYSISDPTVVGRVEISKQSGQRMVLTYDANLVDHVVESIDTSPTYGKLETSTRISLRNKVNIDEQILMYSLEYHDISP